MSEQSIGLIFAFLFPVLFSGMWVFVCMLISHVSGWHTLALSFRTDSKPLGERRSADSFFSSVYMRFGVRYSGVIRAVATEDGIYLSAVFLFRIGHPPLFIPWNEIMFSTKKKWWRRYVVMTLGRKERIPMQIPEQMARQLGIPNARPW